MVKTVKRLNTVVFYKKLRILTALKSLEIIRFLVLRVS